MHTKMVRWKEIYSANIHPELCTFSIFAEARIFNYKSHFAFLSIPRSFLHIPLFELWIKFFLRWNKWSFLPHSEAHISMSCYISIAMYLNRLKKRFVLKERMRNIGKLCDVWVAEASERAPHSPSPTQSFHNQFICSTFFHLDNRIQSFLFMYTSRIYRLSFRFSLSTTTHTCDPYIERKAPPREEKCHT